LSRCSVIAMKSDTSFRAARNQQRAIALGLLPQEGPKRVEAWTDLAEFRTSGGDPMVPLQALVAGGFTADTMEAFRAIGAGSSPWIQLANVLVSRAAAAAGASAQQS
jgi:hypothetical protein